MTLSATMTFTREATTITLPAPDPGSLSFEPVRVQAQVKAADGTQFVDDKGVTHYAASMSLQLTKAQAEDLENFYLNTAQGAVNTFTWLDHENTSWGGCRFDPATTLQFSKSAGSTYAVAVKLITTSTFGT